MKKMIKRFLHRFAFPLISAFMLFSCSDGIDSASTTRGIDATDDDLVSLSDNNGKSDKDTRKDTASSVIDFGDNFIRGFDASAVDYFENVYASSNTWTDKNWYEADGTQKDIFKLLADHGFNTVRLRVWVDPSETSTITDSVWPTSTTGDAWRAGDCTIERATRLAKRAKAVGLKVLLDLHLSDYWTDPAVQLIPKTWQSAATASDMEEMLSSYITETLTYMKTAGVTPDFVQVGNEIDRGILVDSSINTSTGSKVATAASSSINGGINTDNFKTYIKAGCKAVRDFDSSIKIVVHITAQNYTCFDKVDASGADYDIVGLSYYPWENHGTISALKTKIQSFSKPVMIVETSASAKEYTDSQASTAYLNLSGESYADVETSGSKITASESNQTNILRHVMQEIYDAGGTGICVWGGERRDYLYGLFSWEGYAYPAIDAFNYTPADGYPTANNGSTTDEETGDSGNSGETGGSDDTTGNESGDSENSGENETLLDISTSFSGTGSFVKVVDSGSMPSQISELYVALENMSGSGDWWFQINFDGSTWDIAKAAWDDNCSGYSMTITDANLISNLISNGIYAVTGSGLSGTLIIKSK
ncbi:glycosyl hydrolase 53 family protein [Treponema zioleckii]|uniref:glycosyl hydrolase 53 family protein n=1 Tax=Treponema zioleckii TaxID=331680 RepID=UPI00168B4236|nr:glycosyl hydrolase 53 family protein [Treponema zioleckii]